MNASPASAARASDLFATSQVLTLLNHSLTPEVLSLELKTSLQIPAFQIIGLPGPEVSEAKDRVKSALESAGFEFPRRKVVLNLSPSSVRKQGTGMDLAMALSIVADAWSVEAPLFAWGELGLDGRVKGGHHRLRAMTAAFHSEAEVALLPLEDVESLRQDPELLQALRARRPGRPDLQVRGITHLTEALDLLTHRERTGKWLDCESFDVLASHPPLEAVTVTPPQVDLPPALQRWIGVACAGRHHVFLAGPRGVGKSLALEWLIALQPRTLPQTVLEKTLIAELKGQPAADLSIRRVGMQVRPAALFGSLQTGCLRPGEFTLAHGGVLIADEFPEWSRDARESFREPLERGKVTLSRVGQTLELPADFQLAANGNLCPCGGESSENLAHLSLRCRCLPQDRQRYLQKVSGPLLDRVDVLYRVTVAPGGRGLKRGMSACEFSEKVNRVRDELQSRHGQLPGLLSGGSLERILERDSSLQSLVDSLSFSSFRERHRVLRTALTVSAWDGTPAPDKTQFQELMLLREDFFR